MRFNIRSFPFPSKLPVIATGDISYQQHLDGHDHLNPFFLNARPHASNISTQYLPTLLDRVVWCCEGLAKRAQHLATSKNVATKLWPFLNLIQYHPRCMLQHFATGWPNAWNTSCAIMLQDVVCVWPGIWNVFNKDFLTSVYSWRNLNRKLNHLIKLFANLCVQRFSPVVSIYLMTRREVKITGYWPSSFSRFYRPNRSRCPQRRKKNKLLSRHLSRTSLFNEWFMI